MSENCSLFRCRTGRLMVVAALIACHLLFIISCSGVTPEEMAALAARGYYEHLLQGKYENFLQGKAGADSLPEAYREQLLAGYKQFMVQQERVHHGILDVRVAGAKTDTLLHYTNVFLVFCFGDSTNEQIAVPMIEQNGRWRMK